MPTRPWAAPLPPRQEVEEAGVEGGEGEGGVGHQVVEGVQVLGREKWSDLHCQEGRGQTRESLLLVEERVGLARAAAAAAAAAAARAAAVGMRTSAW